MGRPKRPGKYVRVNLDMPEDVKARIEGLRDETNAGSLAAVLQRALSVYEYVFKMQNEGASVVVRHTDGEVEHLKLWP